MAFPTEPLVGGPTPVETLTRLRHMLGGGPTLLVKRDDAIPFAFGGNKVRKLAFVAAQARRDGADTLITAGGVQSNHARATAAAAAKLGMRAILVASGDRPEPLTANALLDRLLGAEVVYVPTRAERMPAVLDLVDRERLQGRAPFAIPIGASTPLGALAYVLALAELVEERQAPDVIVHATSSGGTQAGLVAGCRLLGLPTRVVGISADERAAALQPQIAEIVAGIGELLQIESSLLSDGTAIEVDDRFIGDGYGIPTRDSTAAIAAAARCEALFLDPTYTAKAMAGLMTCVTRQEFTPHQTVLFWHTGGQVGLFA